jgi:hypothetical protein
MNAPRWGNVASREVAEVAMALIRHAAQPGADVERVERELARILPDVPMVCLDGVVDGRAYVEATIALDRLGDPRLGSLQSYLSAS